MCKFKFVVILIAISLTQFISTANVQAQANKPAATTGSSNSEAVDSETAEEEVQRHTFELGYFKINDLRPTSNQTVKLKFTLHLAFTKALTESQIEQLESWKHRLRDQVITSVRLTRLKDFHEPDLALLRRRILIRVNRLFGAKLAEEVLFTEYMFRTH